METKHFKAFSEHAKDFSAQMDSFEYIYSLTDEELPADTEDELLENDNQKNVTRRARNKNHYFTQEHEDAIIKYCLD